jgi:hypothetical protein
MSRGAGHVVILLEKVEGVGILLFASRSGFFFCQCRERCAKLLQLLHVPHGRLKSRG